MGERAGRHALVHLALVETPRAPVPDFEALQADWLPLDEAVRTATEGVRPLLASEAAVGEALGRVLASDLRAAVTMPPLDNAAMDGYAVRASDVRGAGPESPARLRVLRAVHAGSPPGPALVAPGDAVRIMTGAPVPEGADSIVRVEDTDAEAAETGVVLIRSDRDAGRNIRPAGRDFRAGDVVVRAGSVLTPGRIALAVAAGVGRVPVHGAPRVAILSAGDELRAPGDIDDVRAGVGIPESNGPMIAAAVRAAGGEPILIGPARDDARDIARRVEQARGADLLITIGGASMGEADLMKRVLLEHGLRLAFWRVRMRPGSPLSFGRLDALPVLGLPGNPASAFVGFHLFARPMIRRLVGDPAPYAPVLQARAAEPFHTSPGLCHCLRVSLERDGATMLARSAGPQGSGLVHPLAAAQGLAVVPEGVARVEVGDPLRVLLVDAAEPGRADPGYIVSHR